MKKLTWFVFLFIIAVSCLDEPDCFQLNNSNIIISFKILGFGTDKYHLVGIQTPEVDGVFYVDTIVSQLQLPLNPLAEDVVFLFAGWYGDNEIQLGYNHQVQFVSAACGERYIFSDLKIIGNDFDSVRLVNSTPTRPPSTNIEIYRCPRTNLMGVSFANKRFVEGITTDFSTDIFQPSDSITTINLPINKDDSTTTFIFDFGEVSDTLKVSYTRTVKTLFNFCGEQTLFSKLAVDTTVTDFETVELLSDSIQDLPITNFEKIQ